MFSSKGLFSSIACPVGSDCDLINCFFFHDDSTQHGSGKMEVDDATAQEAPPTKRLKVTSTATDTVAAPLSEHVAKPTPAFSGRSIPQKSLQHPVSQSQDVQKRGADSENSTSLLTPASKERPASPPSLRTPQKPASTASAQPQRLPVKHATESLNPRMLVRNPTSFQNRVKFLKLLHKAFVDLNKKAKNDENMQMFVLEPAQLITLALDEEQKLATEFEKVYGNKIKLRILAYQKMGIDNWKLHLSELVGASTPSAKGPAVMGERDVSSGLSEPEDRQVLRHLIAKQHGLEKYGYVTAQPGESEVADARKGDEVNDGWEQCCRCSTRFQVFPDRRPEDGALTSGGNCSYHPGRKIQGGKGRAAVWNCCNDSIGTAGCDTAPCHVFKVESPSRLATAMQYEPTPDNAELDDNKAVSIDCEMGYTVYGFELIRVTVLSWPKGDRVLDVLVRPFGLVLDLNSRFSGVTKEQFQDAVPYDASNAIDTLQIVGSPRAARDLFFRCINPSTPVIGHSLDNDLHALRVIHPCIVDTVLLWPHVRGLQYRRALKELASSITWKVIQNAGVAGHDSAEDAKAAGDIVRLTVQRQWRQMQTDGWKVQDGKLVPPKLAPRQYQVRKVNNGELRDKEEAMRQAEAVEMEEHHQMIKQNGHKRPRDEDEEMQDAERIVLDYD